MRLDNDDHEDIRAILPSGQKVSIHITDVSLFIMQNGLLKEELGITINPPGELF